MKPKGRRIAILTGVLALTVLGIAAWVSWPRIVFRSRFDSLGANAQGYAEYRHRKTGIVFVRLPGGRFLMGAQKDDPTGPNYDPEAEGDEGPVHEVVVSPFLIAKHEVTQAEWERVMGSNPSIYQGGDRPVENMPWEEVLEFEKRTGLSVPTEAMWEYACRGETSAPVAGTGKLDDMGWYSGTAGGTTHPGGRKAANRFGLADLHGNVWEWCADVYDPCFYGKPEARGRDPISAGGTMYQVARGGCWNNEAAECRSANRGGPPPVDRGAGLGLRAVYSPAP